MSKLQTNHRKSVSPPTAQMSRYARVCTPASNERGSAEVVAGCRQGGMVRSRREPAQKNPLCSSLPSPLSSPEPPTQLSPLAQLRARVAPPPLSPTFSSPAWIPRDGTGDKGAVRCRIGENIVTWGSKGQYGAVRWKWAQYRAAAQRNSKQFYSDNDAERHPTSTKRRAILQGITCTHNKR